MVHRRLSAAAVVLLALASPASAQLSLSGSDIGKQGAARMRTAPFPHPTRPQFTNDSVQFFVPTGYVKGSSVDIIVHYHGHRDTAASAIARHKLREQLAASGKNAILIVPQGPVNASDSAGGKHEEGNGLKNFLAEALQLLAAQGVVDQGARPGRVILSGHSGAFRVIARALQGGGVPVSEVWLHDGLYGQLETFARWAAGGGRRFFSTHTPGGGTRGHNGTLASTLRQRGVPVVTSDSDGAHTGARAVIVAAGEGHQAVVYVSKRFERMCKTSGLSERRTTADARPRTPGLAGLGSSG